MQNNRQSERSLKNTSLVTTFCSFVDLLRPDRGILENVAAIGFNRIDRGKPRRETEENSSDTEEDTEEQRTQNTLSQVIACLVSMGYQVNHFVMNSPDYGSAQRRSRMMITIAAPGLSPMEKPPQTHRPLDKSSSDHSSDGPSLEQHNSSNAPFTQLVARDRIGDLPNIGNGIVQMCIPFPDHRIACSMTKASREGLRQLPPRDEEERQNQSSRLCKNSLMPTIRTDSNRQNPKYGPSVHWDQDRILTIQEARRAQGWPDEEVIIGSLRKQYEIVGNGVERSVSYTLGQSLHRSILKDMKAGRRSYVHDVEEQDGDEMATSLQHERERSSTTDLEQLETMPEFMSARTRSNSVSNNEVSAVVGTVKRKRKRISRREVQALCASTTKFLQRQATRAPTESSEKRRRRGISN
jgi:DNA (cytosine-5)-methyltransferase 1